MKKLFAGGFGVLALMLGYIGQANAAFINFDAHASTTLVGGTPPAAAVVTDDYASLGILFGRAGVSAGVAVVNNTNTFSTPNGACALNAGGDIMSACSGDTYFSFIGTTDDLSFVIGDAGGDLDLWTINVYGLGDVLLESRDVQSIANILVSFAHAGMHRVEILDTSGNTAGYLLDNMTFDVVAVPEPGTLALLGAGLLGLVTMRRRPA